MKCCILIGYMCVGKTTIGRELASRTGRMFYDLDWYIEERFHTKVASIFEQEGEERFRELERRMLHEVAEFEDVVLACGGGTPCFFDNMDYMNATAKTFYLKASTDTILEHLTISKGRRPLLEGKTGDELTEFISTQLAARAPFYSKAQHIVEIPTLKSAERVGEVASTIIELENINN